MDERVKLSRYTFFCLLFVYTIASLGQKTNNDTILYKTDSLLLTYKTATHGNDTIYNARREEQQLIKQADLEGTDIKAYVDITYTPLSLVGNILSYEKNQNDLWGSYLSGSSYITTINVVTQKPYSILNLVEENALLDAIKNDVYLKASGEIDTFQLKKCKTFTDALSVLNDQLPDDYHFSPYSYAVLGYDRDKNKVLIRLIKILPRMGTFTSYLQLGLTATPVKTVEEKLKQTENFYLGTYKKGRLASQSFYKKE